ncbi:hypothetical protein H257_17868 [Aphanomyces astaci]|uniref:Uncharacterized protein n=1 Tax=Aphanomyces astaci TaxID=112090 RepID=W4FD38_APHAT|nr:hypothetical protein H257_17868 [Aphanomyces astaci]ETV65407.1 hypothetical protein H257_17868 [Aphanomyces astaci]|eukprot:XP_009845122.1 hypothetical protein H257_17868 [Aphanomyces astaci]
MNVQDLCNAIVKSLQNNVHVLPAAVVAADVARTLPPPVAAKSQRQMTLDSFVSHAVVPTARSANEAWTQWFTGDPAVGLYQPLRSFNKQMIRADRRKSH